MFNLFDTCGWPWLVCWGSIVNPKILRLKFSGCCIINLFNGDSSRHLLPNLYVQSWKKANSRIPLAFSIGALILGCQILAVLSIMMLQLVWYIYYFGCSGTIVPRMVLFGIISIDWEDMIRMIDGFLFLSTWFWLGGFEWEGEWISLELDKSNFFFLGSLLTQNSRSLLFLKIPETTYYCHYLFV